MKVSTRYTALTGEPPTLFKMAAPHFVYYDKIYLDIHNHPEILSHYLIDTVEDKIAGMIHFVKNPSGQLVSIPAAPFGSFHLSGFIGHEVLNKWIGIILKPGMIIKHFPEIYQTLAIDHLLNQNSRRKVTNLNHHILLSDFELSILHSMQQRRIKKCIGASFSFQRVSEKKELLKIHQFLSECRKEQGLSINISCEKLIESFDKLPGHYFAFMIKNQADKIVAANIVVKVNDQTVYHYLPGSAKEFKSYSPMSFLIFETANFFKRQSFKFLDMGLSSIDGKEQTSLASFKERMGSIRADINTYSY